MRRGARNIVLECASSIGSGQESAKMREWSCVSLFGSESQLYSASQ